MHVHVVQAMEMVCSRKGKKRRKKGYAFRRQFNEARYCNGLPRNGVFIETIVTAAKTDSAGHTSRALAE